MSLSTILKYLTFIPWILYFVEIIYYRISIVESCKMNNKKYLEHINKHLFSSINVKELILFFIFIFFILAKNTVVLEILFSAIYLFLLIDFFHTLAYDCKKIHHPIFMVCSVTLLILIILFFALTHKLYTTYIIMFIVSILNSFWIYFLNLFGRTE